MQSGKLTSKLSRLKGKDSKAHNEAFAALSGCVTISNLVDLAYRTGLGFDAHRFGEGRALRLGGIEIPGAPGLVGHSDGDAALHALSDALLGAAALGDLGTLFPSSDARHAGADSRAMLRRVVAVLAESGWAPAQVDLTIIAEQPRLAAHVAAMRSAIAEVLTLALDRVSVKPKSTDGMGSIGRGEGIAALAVATIGRSAK